MPDHFVVREEDWEAETVYPIEGKRHPWWTVQVACSCGDRWQASAHDRYTAHQRGLSRLQEHITDMQVVETGA